MRIPVPAEKAREMEVYAEKITELLRTAKILDETVIPYSVKGMSVFELKEAPVRVKNMLCNMGVCTLWELVHFNMTKCRAIRGGFMASRHRMAELMYAIKEAIDLLTTSPKDFNKKMATMSDEETMSDDKRDNLNSALDIALAVLKEEEDALLKGKMKGVG